MKNTALNVFIWLLIALLSIILLFELFNSIFKVIIISLGIVCIIIPKRVSSERPHTITVIGILMVALSLLSTVSAWILLVLLVIIFLSENQDFFNTIKQSFLKTTDLKKNSEFVTVQFEHAGKSVAKKTRTSWIGTENKETDLYEWEDINYTKVFGNTIIDLGNTIVPKDQSIIMIRNGIGDIRVLVPDEVGVSLDLNILVGNIKIGEEEFNANNETIKWKTERYSESTRQLKIAATTLFGQIEVIFI